MGREHEKRNYGTAAAKSQVMADGGGGGGGVEYLNAPLTDSGDVDSANSSGGNWVFDGANGAQHSTSGANKGVLWWSTAASPSDNASLSITWHSIVSAGVNADWELHVLAADLSLGSRQRPDHSIYVQLDYQTARLVNRINNANETELDSAAITAIGAGDTLKLVVTPNGSNFDATAYINDVEILSATNIVNANLGTASAFRHESAAAGADGVVKNIYGESAA